MLSKRSPLISVCTFKRFCRNKSCMEKIQYWKVKKIILSSVASVLTQSRLSLVTESSNAGLVCIIDRSRFSFADISTKHLMANFLSLKLCAWALSSGSFRGGGRGARGAMAPPDSFASAIFVCTGLYCFKMYYNTDYISHLYIHKY